MDVTASILGIALINVAVFLVGCSIAVVRTRAERSTASDRSTTDPAAVRGRAAKTQLRQSGRRAHRRSSP